MEELLTYQSVEICFNGETVIRDVSFALHPGEILLHRRGIRQRKEFSVKSGSGTFGK